MDEFLERIQTGTIPDDILHFWETFNGYVSSSMFHLHDSRVASLVTTLHKAWGESLIFGTYSTPSANHRYHSFDALGDIFTPEQEKAWNTIQEAAGRTRDAFRATLSCVREDYAEIDLEQTTKDAWTEFVEFRARNDHASDTSNIEAAAEPPPASKTDGFRAYDIAILVILMAEDGAPLPRVQHEMGKTGFTRAATGIGIEKLRRLGLIMYRSVRQSDPEYESTEQWLVLTKDGIDWLLNNEERVQLQVEKQAPAPG